MAESTAALAFSDLIITVAEKLGIGYYGSDGLGVAQVPVNAYDLDKCKRYVQDGVRMFIADAPAAGWRWQRPIASVVLWADIAEDEDVTVTGGVHDPDAGTTPVTATDATFYPSMEGATITIDGAGEFVIDNYVSATVVNVVGNASAASADVFSMASSGVFSLPSTFGGEVTGEITYAAGSNLGTEISWTSELEIRRRRENWDSTAQHPYRAAVRQNQSDSRRWELVVFPTPGSDQVVEFPYVVYFDKIVNLTDMHPAGVAHDEAVKWAALGQAELQGEDAAAGYMNYYKQSALPASYRVDDRAAPRRLGYCGNPRSTTFDIHDFRKSTPRPTVGFS